MPDTTTLDEIPDSFFDYEKVAGPAIAALLGDWSAECAATTRRRNERKVAINADEEKDAGNLDADEVFIPIRLIDSNIRKELAKHAAYLTKSPRDIIVTCLDDFTVDGSPIEKDFTNKFRYNGWEKAYLNWADGVETHAWDFIEVLFDSKKPGHCYVEHVGHDQLKFPRETKDIQAADFLIREIEYTNNDLKLLIRNSGFDPVQTKKIIDANAAALSGSAKQERNSDPKLSAFALKKIQKVFFKNIADGFVYVAWACNGICDNWVKAPRKLFLGQIERNSNYIPPVNPLLPEDPNNPQFIQLFETSYPIEIDVYSFSEDECIMHLQGRVDLDRDKAEAATSLMTSACTMMRRAAQQYWTLADGTQSGADFDDAQTEYKVAANKIFNRALKAWNLPAPPPEIFSAIFQIIGQSQQESGDINYAVQSNKSTRKTSAEVKLAKEDNDMLSSIQVTLRSIALRNARTRCYDIYRSRVLAGLIKAPELVTNLLAKYTWIIKPAGDVDVIERQKKTQQMQAAWPVYSNTAARNVYLQQLTKLLFPDEAGLYIKALEEGEMVGKYIMAMMQVLTALIQDGQNDPALAPKIPQLTQLLQQGQQLLQNMKESMSDTGSVTTEMTQEVSTPAPTNEIEASQQRQVTSKIG